MKNNIFRLAVVLFLALLYNTGISGQTLSTSGSWSTTTITETNKSVTLTGDLTVNGTITVPAGKTLTINGGGKKITVYAPAHDSTTPKNYKCFDVTGILIIKNAVLDGGNNGTISNLPSDGNGENTNVTGSWTKTSSAIVIEPGGRASIGGTSAADSVTVQNMYGAYGTSNTGFLWIVGSATATASAELNHVTVRNCLNHNDLGVIYSNGSNYKSKITISNSTITNCMVKSNTYGIGYGGVIKGAGKADCNLIMTNSIMQHCWSSGWGGAILWAANANDCKAVLTDCTFRSNYARYLGGAISSEAVVELNNCDLYGNVAGYGGGAIAAFPFTLEDTEGVGGEAVGITLSNNSIHNNKTLFVTNYDKSIESWSDNAILNNKSDKGFNPRVTITNASDVAYPSGGGGIWVLMYKDGWNCSLNIGNGNKIYENHSALDGGGVFLYKQRPFSLVPAASREYVGQVVFSNQYSGTSGQTSMTADAEIYGNTASHSGGGLAVGADTGLNSFPTITVNQNGKILYNIAQAGNGGGIYMPGGDFTLNGGLIEGNIALAPSGSSSSALYGNGGGVSVTQGSFTANSSSQIKNNEADNWGGGVFVYNTGNISQKVLFNGGTYSNNHASNAGGGVCVDGLLTLEMDGNIEGNTAENGGGIYLRNQAKMIFGSGLIRNNMAVSEESYTFETAYHASLDDAFDWQGIGGGAFLDSNTSLSFDSTLNEMGFYGNIADSAADDIFANGNGTEVLLPFVGNMELKGFNVPSDKLYWAEDYAEDDTQYATYGTHLMQNEDKVRRYRDALSNAYPVYYFPDDYWTDNRIDSFKNKYICLVLGYELIYVTVIKNGLKAGHSAEFIFKPVKNYNTTDEAIGDTYMKVLFTGTGTGGVKKTVVLPSGFWQITESSWDYQYTLSRDGLPSNNIFEINKEHNALEFTNIYRYDGEDITEKPLSDEAIKVNRMGRFVPSK